MNRRKLLQITAGMTFAALANTRPAAAAKIGIVAPTFDTYSSTYHVAFPCMRARGLVGTFFVEPFLVEKVGAPTRAMLLEMQAAGWEIGAYSGPNMFVLHSQSEEKARARLVALRERMNELGFAGRSLAPNQRSWKPELAALSAGLFDFVRVADMAGVQPLPITEPRYVRGGGRLTGLNHTDTAASLRAEAINAGEACGLWIPVVHQVGNDAEPAYSVPTDTFGTLCDDLANLVAIGAVKVTTFAQACSV